MASLSYSSGGLDSLPLFHRRTYVVYVEGPDDLPFWEFVLAAFGLESFIVKPAGGAPELDRYAKAIVDDGVSIVVARDLDYADLLGDKIDHPRIVYTYGYSIENTLYCPKNLAAAIALYTRSPNTFEDDARDWLQYLASGLRQLVIMEVANLKNRRGIRVMGDNCYRFLQGRSCKLDATTVSSHEASIAAFFTDEETDEARALVAGSARPLVYLIRGHFLTNAVKRFIESRIERERGTRMSISHEALYAQLVGQLRASCLEPEDQTHLQEQVDALRTAA